MSLLQKIVQAFRKSSVVRSPVRPAPRARRPCLEALEDRLAPATYTWIGAAGANWNVAANWAGGVAGNSRAAMVTSQSSTVGGMTPP